jgi:hypothetical protein
MTDEDLNEQIAELEAQFWPLVREGQYDTAKARALADQIHELRAQRRGTVPEPDDEQEVAAG